MRHPRAGRPFMPGYGIAGPDQGRGLLPWTWAEALSGASGKTWELAAHLLYQHWEGNGAPIKLANGMLGIDGINRWSKWRALSELERRGLVVVERRRRRSPIVRLNLLR